jgi:hypothetical protein
MNLLILITGNSDKQLIAHGFDVNDFEIVKVDEKELAKPCHILSIIKRKKYNQVYYGCIELILQRFHFFMMLYLFLSWKWKGGIIDESGYKINFNIFKFLFYYIPLIVVEILLSIYIIIIYTIKIPIYKWKLKKN